LFCFVLDDKPVFLRVDFPFDFFFSNYLLPLLRRSDQQETAVFLDLCSCFG
jgi:hypothetical protein